MGKHQNRWEPRRRAFDDSRSDEDRPEPDFFQRQTTTAPIIDAEVKWFNAVKGFGFVMLADGSDAFLHIKALERSGHSQIGEGTDLKVRVEQGHKGRQVSEVVEVGENARPAEPTRSFDARGSVHQLREEREGFGAVKWYDAVKGFGFVSVDGLPKDVFVHASALNRSGVSALETGQKVRVMYAQGQKGPEVRSINLV